MAKLKRCDLCGAEADELMSIEFPYEERWMIFFRKKAFAHYADICLDCLEKIRAERQAQIKANEVDFEIADTPQTDLSTEEFVEGMKNLKMEVKQTDCKTCRHYKLACELFSEVCKYEPTTQTETQNSNLTFDTPQTDSTGSPIGDYRDGVGAWQTDCGWSKPNE